MTVSTVRLIFRADGPTVMRQVIFPTRAMFSLSLFPTSFGEKTAPALGMEINQATFFRGVDTLFITLHHGTKHQKIALMAKLADLYAIERISPTGRIIERIDPLTVGFFPD